MGKRGVGFKERENVSLRESGQSIREESDIDRGRNRNFLKDGRGGGGNLKGGEKGVVLSSVARRLGGENRG